MRKLINISKKPQITLLPYKEERAKSGNFEKKVRVVKNKRKLFGIIYVAWIFHGK